MECTLRGIFQEHFEAYAERRRLPLYVHRAAYWISRCRTAELGGHVRRCPAGHVERAFYNSCHQRGCAQCQAMATESWLERQRARLLGCAHHHLIFTIPHALAADGGLDENGVWVQPRRSHFLPARVLMLLFRGKLLAALRAATERGKLRLPPDSSRERCLSILNRLGRKKWNAHIRARYAHGEGVAAYLARFGQTPEAARCPRCGSILLFVSALPHGTGPPPTLH